MELKSPTKKGFKAPRYHSPLPICNDASSTICSNEYDWPLFTGQYNGTSVIIDDPNEIILLSKKGCFGKGSLSKGAPASGKRKSQLSIITESQWKRRKHWIESLSAILKQKDFSLDSPLNKVDESKTPEKEDSSREPSKEPTMDVDTICAENSVPNNVQEVDINVINLNTDDVKEEISLPNDSSKVVDIENKIKVNGKHFTSSGELLQPDEVLVIADLENNLDEPLMLLNPHIEKENVKTVIEVLYLSLEEAFFLSYALNCLQVIDLTSKLLSIQEMWILFQQSQADFIEKYVAYHYFRAKGWVVKSGIKFGGDFLLYKKGPQYFHASYIVLIQLLNHDGSKANTNNSLTWKKTVGVNRMAETANKEILLFQVKKPESPKEAFNDPAILKEFSVGELLLRRWQATHEKASQEKE